MRTIVHLSDLHFGRVDAALLDSLVATVKGIGPDVVAISGDLTQRARVSQFIQARDFLARLPKPQIVVPGNHDIPLYDVMRRFAAPRRRFRRYITDDPAPFHVDEEIAIAGIDTARSLTFKGGRINQEQVLTVADRFAQLPRSLVRVVVTHHPFDLPEHAEESGLVGRAVMAMRVFAECGVDLFLSGHLHHSHHSSAAERYDFDGRAGLIIQAGTATSTRGRGETNAFNVIRIDGQQLGIDVLNWEHRANEFRSSRTSRFRRGPNGWLPEVAA